MTGPGPGAIRPARAPLFSVVTVTLDAGERLARTVRSVGEQTWGDLEHLIQDGGSRDGSTSRIPADARVHVVVARDDGVYDAMNQALRRCRGRYVMFLNAGDCFCGPSALAGVAERIRDDGAGLYYCDILRADEGTTARYPDRLSRFFLFRRPLCHQACFFARAVYERLGGFDVSFRIAADYEFLLRAVLRGEIDARHVGVPAVAYEGGGLSASASNRAALVDEERRIRARHFTPWERVRYSVAVGLTLRPLRTALFRHEALRGFRPLYQRAANAWNRASWR